LNSKANEYIDKERYEVAVEEGAVISI